jgi:eukaryotic-like serine/threonine-protein kinase
LTEIVLDKNESDQTIDLDPNCEAGHHRVTLRVMRGPHSPRQWVFDRQTIVTLGRSSPSNIRFTKEPAMSKTHCELHITPPHIHLVDLSSTNGTLVNEVHLAEADLHHGDVFGIGETRLMVECEDIREPDTMVVNPKSPVTARPIPMDARPDKPIDTINRTRLARPLLNKDEPPKAKPSEEPKVKAKETPKPLTQAPLGDTNAAGASEVTGDFFPPASQTPAPHANELSGRTIGAYDVIEQLGQGGMATVYRAKHRKSAEEVAIKVVQGAVAPSDKMLQLFVREASVLSQLKHARIVKCLEFGLHEQQPFIVMELIPTIDLLSLIAKQTEAAKIKTACWVASRVLQALDYAHKSGIVHRDVKPGNILAYREAHRLQVKLCDFGLAKCYEDAGFSAMTDDLSVRGTLAYMAPEQLRDARSARPPVDIFATGACLYRMLVGKHPTMTSQGAVFSQADFDAAGLPKPLATVVAKAMHSDPKKRYKIAPEFEHALYPFHQRP